MMMGSHIDTVRTGGRYDGALGVLAGLEVVETLDDAGVVTRRPLAVAFFTNEEGARFQPDMFGSLVFTGALPLERGARHRRRRRRGRRRGAAAHRLCRRSAGRPAERPRLCRAARRAGADARGGRLRDRRGRRRAGHLLDRIYADRPVEPRRHDADADAPRRRLCRRRDRGLRATARARARRRSGRDRRRADAVAQSRQRRRRTGGDDGRSAQHRQRAAQARPSGGCAPSSRRPPRPRA